MTGTLATYRRQQGIAPITAPKDPVVVAYTKRAQRELGLTPRQAAVLYATTLVESGGRRFQAPGVPVTGDGGHSFGELQFNDHGALAGHSPLWSTTYEAFKGQAGEFKRLGVQGGKGAAAVQRPQDRELYAHNVDAQIQNAFRILGLAPPAHVVAASNAHPAGRALAAPTTDRLAGLSGAQRLALVNELGKGSSDVTGLLDLLQQAAPAAKVAPISAPVPARARASAAVIGRGIIGVRGAKLIGLPGQGTHTLGNWESDNAIDIPAPVGTPVYAFANGTIGSQIGALNSQDPHMQGLRVHVDAANQSAYYAHLSKLVVTAGQRVKKGQLIGYSGSANGVQHLHVAVQHGDPRSLYR